MTTANTKNYYESIDNFRCNEYEFKKTAMEFCEALKVVGIHTLPFHSSYDLHFSKRSKKDQKKILAYLDISLSVLNECIMSGEDAFDNRVLLWRVFKKIGGAPQDDLFDKIGDDDLVEIYFPDHTPLFRNLKFYREFSYTVDEALCQTWYQFCRRDLVVTLKTMRFALNFMKDSRHTKAWTIPPHYVDERGTAMEYRALMIQKYLSGIHSGGELKAIISTSDVTIVGAKRKLF
ncbi:hypothetical protein SHI21_18835 [Bacteriovorax sp. PP10]|uniref:Uncharacterized protein n=1 Tax=Bacteriovorax antarcticus TaxID=3088717 RepID=A0ABU5VYZ4_9BACT|nr:hypothetical protein [Bacteriovorax sp. PP10]MEA9358299.1 hypothetical protein [Bacteriovorax sp. PP10]